MLGEGDEDYDANLDRALILKAPVREINLATGVVTLLFMCVRRKCRKVKPADNTDTNAEEIL